MKRILLILVLTLAVTFVSNALDYEEAGAVTKARSEMNWTESMAATNCRDCTPCRDDETGDQNTSAECTSGPNARNTIVWAYAEARKGMPYWVFVHDTIRAAYSDWAWAKGGPKDPGYVHIQDSLHANVMCYPGSPTVIDLQIMGFMRICPEWCSNARTWFKVRLWEKHTNHMCFDGEARLTGGHLPRLTCTGDISTTDFTVTTLGDTTWARINKLYSFYCDDVNCDSLALELTEYKRAYYVPTVTQWGIIVLVALLIVSAVFVMLKRRKAMVPA
jgi:hypothetical protein